MACCLLAMAALGPGIALIGWLRQMLGGTSTAKCCPAMASRHRSRAALVAALALMAPAGATLANYGWATWQAHQVHLKQALDQVETDLQASRCKATPAPEARTGPPNGSVALLSQHIAKERGDR